MAASPSKDLSAIYPPITLNEGNFLTASAMPSAQNRFAAAPMPNKEVFAPRVVATPGAVVGPGLFRASGGYRGDGFTPDSSQQTAQQAKRMPVPGISLKVPLY